MIEFTNVKCIMGAILRYPVTFILNTSRFEVEGGFVNTFMLVVRSCWCLVKMDATGLGN